MHKSRVLFVPLVVIGVAGATRAAEAATVVRNVSTVAQLYSEFAAADNDPNNLHEIHLAAGTYRLICPTSGDSLTTRGFSRSACLRRLTTGLPPFHSLRPCRSWYAANMRAKSPARGLPPKRQSA